MSGGDTPPPVDGEDLPPIKELRLWLRVRAGDRVRFRVRVRVRFKVRVRVRVRARVRARVMARIRVIRGEPEISRRGDSLLLQCNGLAHG